MLRKKVSVLRQTTFFVIVIAALGLSFFRSALLSPVIAPLLLDFLFIDGRGALLCVVWLASLSRVGYCAYAQGERE